MENKDYSVAIESTSRELTVKEKIQLPDLADAVRLDEAVQPDAPLIIDVDAVVVLAIHNEKAKEDKDYNTIVILAKDGTKYSTSSYNVYNAIDNIVNACIEGGVTDYSIKVLKRESNNYKGKYFLTATIA